MDLKITLDNGNLDGRSQQQVQRLLDWIRSQHGNELPAEVSLILNDSAPDNCIASGDLGADQVEDYNYNAVDESVDTGDGERSTCNYCSNTFHSLVELSKHALIHCKLLIPRLSSKSAGPTVKTPRAGVKVYEHENMFHCGTCESKFTSRGKALTHWKRTHADMRDLSLFKCLTCGKVLSSNACLRQHFNDVHSTSQTSHLCSFCGQKFRLEKYLKKHVAYVHVQKRDFKCTHCQAAFVTSHSLKVHESRHLGTNKRQCPYCGILQAHNSIKNHIDFMHEGKRLKCNSCGELLSSTTSVRSHFFLKHMDQVDYESVQDVTTPVRIDVSPSTRVGGLPDLQTREAHSNGNSMINELETENLQAQFELVCQAIQVQEQGENVHGQQAVLLNEKCKVYNEHASKNSEDQDNNQCTVAIDQIEFLTREVQEKFHDQVFQNQDEFQGQSYIITTPTLSIPKRHCPICLKYYTHLEAHNLRSHSTGNKLKCKFCEREFKCYSSLHSHVRWFHLLRSGKLSKVSKPTRLMQKKISAKRLKLACIMCNVAFDKRLRYDIHMRKHSMDPEYRVASKKRVKRLCESNADVKTVLPLPGTTNIPFCKVDCPYKDCDHSFQGIRDLRQHLKALHPDFTGYASKGTTGNEPELERESLSTKSACLVCGKLIFWCNLKRHISQVHGRVRSFSCSVCKKSFHQKSTLELHETTIRHKQLKEQALRERRLGIGNVMLIIETI